MSEPFADAEYLAKLRADTAALAEKLRAATPAEIAAAASLPAGRPGAHDPDVCGLPGPPTCPGCVADARAGSAVAAEMKRIAGRFEEADRRAKAAASFADRAAAEAERLEAEGEFLAVGRATADLFLLLLRHALRHRADELRGYLTGVLRPELKNLIRLVTSRRGKRDESDR